MDGQSWAIVGGVVALGAVAFVLMRRRTVEASRSTSVVNEAPDNVYSLIGGVVDTVGDVVTTVVTGDSQQDAKPSKV